MQDFCPLCLKNGIKNKVKLLQINLQEGVWVCSEEKCVWPFGYKDFALCPRPVGKIWSCYWDDYKSTMPRAKDNVTMPIKPISCSEPVPLIQNTLKEFTVSGDTYCSNEINDTCVSLNELRTATDLSDLCISSGGEASILSNIDSEKQCSKDHCILNKESIASESNLNNCSLQLVESNTKDIILENECTSPLNKHINEKASGCIQNVRNVNTVRGIPIITSIEKTNIDISNVKIGNQITLYQDLDNKIKDLNKATGIMETKLVSKVEGLSNSEPTESDKAITNSNLSVTKVEIDGLPPITLSFDISGYVTKPETIISNTQWTGTKNSVQQNTPELKNRVIKRSITCGRQYEKFSFSAIKKKIETSNCNNTNLSDVKAGTNIGRVENESTDNIKKNENRRNVNNFNTVNISSNSGQTMPVVSSNTSRLNQLDNSITHLSSQEDVSSDTLAVNTSMNLDTVLDDLLSNDYSVSEDLNDEWLNSLLS